MKISFTFIEVLADVSMKSKLLSSAYIWASWKTASLKDESTQHLRKCTEISKGNVHPEIRTSVHLLIHAVFQLANHVAAAQREKSEWCQKSGGFSYCGIVVTRSNTRITRCLFYCCCVGNCTSLRSCNKLNVDLSVCTSVLDKIELEKKK